MSRRLARAGAVLGTAIVLAACGGAPPASPIPVPSGALVIRAVNSTFEPPNVTAPASGSLTIYFDNADALPHNLVLVAADGKRSLSGDVFTGPAQRVYEVPALATGAYKILCEVHPGMSGTLTVP